MSVQQKILPLSFYFFVALLVSACSATQTMDQLQSDFNKNSQSNYVRDNLKNQPETKQSNGQLARQSLDLGKLKRVQNHSFIKRKRRIIA